MNYLIPGVERRPFLCADESHNLIANLIKLYDSHAKLNGDKKPTVKCTVYSVPGEPSVKLRSWKFNEFSYGDPEKPLPTNARGLFSYTNPTTSRHSIVLRGYDKFFNADEKAVTKWEHLEKATDKPYVLSLKQNGCIIFIGALDSKTLLVSSKHSIGARADLAGESHSERGRIWLKKHLLAAGKTELDLAGVLFANNLTAVCELCDDEFEEHILGYPPEKSGLYMHGLNVNGPTFSTYPASQVNKFAAYFGLLSNPHFTINNMQTLKDFLAECARTGTYQNTEIEGFVIRTQMAGADFFFKYKFEEPYLLYRQWREVTKALIGNREPKFRTHRQITKEYIKFILPIINDPAIAATFNENHGIISLREKFLSSRGGAPFTETHDVSVDYSRAAFSKDARFVLVPVATIGCGKTTVALALQSLLGIGHIQNDNILAKKSAHLFAKDVYTSFTADQTRVVYADRNNHMLHERSSLIRDILALKKTLDPPIHFIALSFDQNPEIRKVTADRVIQRGDNHQSIRAATMGAAEVKIIMDGFHHRFQTLNLEKGPDTALSDVVELDPLKGSRKNLEIVCKYLFNKEIIDTMPSDGALDKAYNFAINYRPTVHKVVTSHSSDKASKKDGKNKPKNEIKQQNTRDRAVSKNVLFYGLQVLDTASLVYKLESIFKAEPHLANFWSYLKANGRIQKEFHITLVHENQRPSHVAVWEHYSSLSSRSQTRYTIHLDCICFDDRVMAIKVSVPDLPYTNQYPHITIGTSNASIKPFESNQMLAKPESEVKRISIDLSIDCMLKAY